MKTISKSVQDKINSLSIKWNRIFQDILDEVNENIRKSPEYQKTMRLEEGGTS